MRKIFTVVAVVAALLAVGASSASAKLTLLSGRATWVGQLDGGTLAYGDSRPGSGIELVGATGGPRAVAPPAGCGGVAAGSGHLLFDCPTGRADRFREVVTAADGTRQATRGYQLPLTGGRGALAPDAIGDQWIEQPTGCAGCASWPMAYNWVTGETRGLDAPPPSTREDLDVPGLAVGLCPPLERAGALGVEVSGNWVLLQDARGWTLHRCGSSKTYTIRGGRPIALQSGYVILSHRYSPGLVSLTAYRLSDHGYFPITGLWPTGTPPRFAMTSRRLLILGDLTSTSSLWSMPLPPRV